EGFRLSVTPNRLVVPAGQSRSFTLTVTNETSPRGEWAFGSITWAGDGYEARSPVAVRGEARGVPAQVDVTGTSGPGGAEVSFGSSGGDGVEACGRGAEAATPATAAQGPDPTCAPSDAGSGAGMYPLGPTGVELYRCEMAQSDVTSRGTDLGA